MISYFSTRDWKFTNKNVQDLWQKLDEDDKKLFDFNIDELDWDRYFYSYVRGIRLYLLKDDFSTIPQALARYTRYVSWFTHRKPQIHRKNAVCKYFPWTSDLLLVSSQTSYSGYLRSAHKPISYRHTLFNFSGLGTIQIYQLQRVSNTNLWPGSLL